MGSLQLYGDKTLYRYQTANSCPYSAPLDKTIITRAQSDLANPTIWTTLSLLEGYDYIT